MIYFLIFIPYILASLLQFDPITSYWVAWAGSFFIFYLTLLSPFKKINKDLEISQQVMRPIFILQIIFAGFMCCTSIFFFLNNMGYRYFEKVVELVQLPNPQTYLIAECQRLSVLGHAALVAGILLLTPQKEKHPKKFILRSTLNINQFLIHFTLITYGIGLVVQQIPAIFQFSLSLFHIATFGGAFLLIKGWLERKTNALVVGLAIFIINFIQATLSGLKEPILLNFIIVGCLIFPYYKKLTLIIGIPLMYGLFYILPTYVNIIRTESWAGNASAEQARGEAVETLFSQNDEASIDQTNWEFLINRFSEINMFTQYVNTTPSKIDFYGFQIIEQSLEALMPRVLWPEKQSTEEVAMDRVYAAGVVSDLSSVSAKTRPVVDAYLTDGSFGVFICLLIYGLVAQVLCNLSERLFGGYQLGTMIIFSGIFQPMWRGNNFEFIINSVFYGYIFLLILHLFFRIFKVLEAVDTLENQEIIYHD